MLHRLRAPVSRFESRSQGQRRLVISAVLGDRACAHVGDRRAALSAFGVDDRAIEITGSYGFAPAFVGGTEPYGPSPQGPGSTARLPSLAIGSSVAGSGNWRSRHSGSAQVLIAVVGPGPWGRAVRSGRSASVQVRRCGDRRKGCPRLGSGGAYARCMISEIRTLMVAHDTSSVVRARWRCRGPVSARDRRLRSPCPGLSVSRLRGGGCSSRRRRRRTSRTRRRSRRGR